MIELLAVIVSIFSVLSQQSVLALFSGPKSLKRPLLIGQLLPPYL